MSTLVSITVVVNDGQNDQTFNVDIANNCMLVWDDAGWDVLMDYYKDVKKDHKKAKEVKDRQCPEAKPRHGAALAKAAPLGGGSPVIALKDPECNPTQWP